MNDDYITACCGLYPNCDNCPYAIEGDSIEDSEEEV